MNKTFVEKAAEARAEGYGKRRLMQNHFNFTEKQPVRIQRSRKEKQVSPNNLPIKYCGRPTKYGNPFKVIGEPGNWFIINDDGDTLFTFDKIEQAIDQCLIMFEEYFENEINLGIINIEDLRGYNLSCWCKLTDKCHVDIILKKLNYG